LKALSKFLLKFFHKEKSAYRMDTLIDKSKINISQTIILRFFWMVQ